MANRTFYPAMSFGIGRVYLDFLFTANGASVPALSTVDGAVGAVSAFSHTGATNVIGVTLADQWPKVIGVQIEIVGGVADGDWATAKTIANEGTNTPLTFNILTFIAAGTTRTDATGTVMVGMAFRNTAIKGNGA